MSAKRFIPPNTEEHKLRRWVIRRAGEVTLLRLDFQRIAADRLAQYHAVPHRCPASRELLLAWHVIAKAAEREAESILLEVEKIHFRS